MSAGARVVAEMVRCSVSCRTVPCAAVYRKVHAWLISGASPEPAAYACAECIASHVRIWIRPAALLARRFGAREARAMLARALVSDMVLRTDEFAGKLGLATIRWPWTIVDKEPASQRQAPGRWWRGRR